MATSADSRRQSRLIREMSRDLNRTEHSVASSTGSHHGTVSDSTISEFDPENEAIMSTRQMDLNYSQKLPELRDTAKKYGRWNGGRQQQDFVINTSAIGRAFPDFSQGGSSDDSMSMEVGRGAKVRQRTPSRVPRAEYSGDIDSPIVKIGDFQILSTPPIKSQIKTTKQNDTPRSSVRKESQNKRVSISQKENIAPLNASTSTKLPNYTSGASRTSSGEQRRTLAELHARVADESDGSFISDERPPTVNFGSKSSRFSNGQPRNSPLSAVHNIRDQQSNNSLLEILSGKRNASQTASHAPNNGTITSNTQNPTNQSFLLPNMPDISELVSGTFKNGTPVFTHNGKVQSRFSPASGFTPSKTTHVPVDSIPVPDDEKAIFLSLQLLQEKVATLEMEKADAQRIANELQREKYQLQAEKKELERHRRSDSGLGMADDGSDGDNARDFQKLLNEKNKLEAQAKSLQGRLDTAERKVSTQELRLKTVSTERDQAVTQLAQAWESSEQLKTENDLLRQENDTLRQQLAQFVNESEENARKWQQKENLLRQKVQRRDEAVMNMREVTREITRTRLFETVGTQERKSSRPSGGNGSSRVVQSMTTKASSGQNSGRGRVSNDSIPTSSRHGKERQRSRSKSQSRHVTNDQRQSNVTNIVNNTYDLDITVDETSDRSLDEATKTIHKNINLTVNAADDDDHGSNFSSILGHGEMDRLRQLLAEERAIQQERLTTAAASRVQDDTIRSTRSVLEDRNHLQRKASLKGLTGILKNRGVQELDDNTGRLSIKSADRPSGKVDQGHTRRHSENSINSRSTTTRRRHIVEEMTSAFILPDITIHGVSHGVDHKVLSANARRVLDNLAQHDGHNCTVCARVASFETLNADNTTEIKTKHTIHIEKPIPVSDRMPLAGLYEEEPTMRPSVAPGLALATVMKGLQDELAHLKMELAQYQAIYNKHDPSLSKRKRKSVKVKIERLLKAIDKKADQIYALFDVLEGQKQSGQELSEKDVEITLQSICFDADKETEAPEKDEDNADSDSDSDDDSELDLPWEGIDSTTGSRERRQSWQA